MSGAVDTIKGRPTWTEMVRACPALAELAALASRGGGAHDWRAIKARLSYLVGWDARDARLMSSNCYDAAYQKILAEFERKGRF